MDFGVDDRCQVYTLRAFLDRLFDANLNDEGGVSAAGAWTHASRTSS